MILWIVSCTVYKLNKYNGKIASRWAMTTFLLMTRRHFQLCNMQSKISFFVARHARIFSHLTHRFSTHLSQIHYYYFLVNFYFNHLTLLPSQCGLPWINTIKILSIRHLRLHQTFFKLVENQFAYMQIILTWCDWYFCFLS